ncbi:MAG: class I SAM-dependent methyltransferase [Opitutaceae bacterium]
MNAPRAFDSFARRYEDALDKGLRLTGESRDFYAAGRVNSCRKMCIKLGVPVHSVCDYGCGTGDTLPLLEQAFGASRMVGFDTSPESLAEAVRRHGRRDWIMTTSVGRHMEGLCDVVYCNGVFHHIAPAERLRSSAAVSRLLRSGGLWLLWENNPWNPGTRWVMSRIPFDRDAILLSSREARALGESAGLTYVETTFHFFFPSLLRFLRPLENSMRRLPLGGQYLTVLRKSAAPPAGRCANRADCITAP